jgi:outer membrane receptor protein involved in Fe transport
VNRAVLDPDNLFFETLRTTNQVSTTGVINFGLSWGGEHEINTSSLYLRNTEDESSLSEGHNVNFLRADGRGLRNYRIRFEERELISNQIRGRHVAGPETQELLSAFREPFLQDLVYEWYYSDSRATTDIPSEILISAEDQVDPDRGVTQSTQIRRSSTAADYRFTMLEDKVESYGWDLVKPMTTDKFDIELSFGQDNTRKARDYLQTQFGLGTTVTAALPILAGTPGQVFTDANLHDPVNGFSLNIGGIGTESYLAAQTIDGAYIKADAMFRNTWRIAGGFRWEQFRQVSLPIDQLEFVVGVGQTPIANDQLASIVFFEDELYPSISATYEGTDFWAETFQLRFGISETVARPDLREVSASTYIDPLTEARIQGQPGLGTAAITNFDIRAEWLFQSGANFIASIFYKDIENPIETVQGAGTDDNVTLTFVNTESAELYGLEFEWLRDLAFLGDRWGRWIEPFFVSGNLTLSDSTLTVGDIGLNLTNTERPMAQHSEYAANVQLGFDSFNAKHSWSVVYNTFGERLFFAGRGGALDAYEEPFDSLDLIYSYYPTDRLSLKFRFQNLLASEVEITQGDITVIEQNVGTTAKIDLKWDLD